MSVRAALFGSRRGALLNSLSSNLYTRYFSSSSSSSCPFSILGIPKSSSYSDVKKAFIQLALKHHPDTADKSSINYDNNTSFHDIRHAFESICDNGNGGATLANENNDYEQWTDESLDEWFYKETGHYFFGFAMSSKQRQEMTQVSNHMSPGGLDKGGMWEMANAIAKQQQNGSSNVQEDPLQVTSGRREDDRVTSRRRRRKR